MKQNTTEEQSMDWEKRFDSHFQDMDVWVYMDQANDPKGINAKVMDGKKEVKDFIARELQKQSMPLQNIGDFREQVKKDIGVMLQKDQTWWEVTAITDYILQLITDREKELLERVDKEVIGEDDEYKVRVIESDVAYITNGVRAKQRQKLASLKGQEKT